MCGKFLHLVCTSLIYITHLEKRTIDFLKRIQRLQRHPVAHEQRFLKIIFPQVKRKLIYER